MSEAPSNHITFVEHPHRCTSCDTQLKTPVACFACHAIFPVPEETSHFDRLGLPEQFDVDLELAEERFVELSRQLHPDYHGHANSEQQALSLEHSARLNEAIAVIRDPFKRAAYLLQRWYPQIMEERDQQMPDGFLEEMLFLREEIDELMAEDPSPARDARLDAFRADIAGRRDALHADLTRAFERLGGPPAPGAEPPPEVTEIRRTLNAARYILGTLNALRGMTH